MPDSRGVRREEFQALLREYRSDHHLTVKELAERLDRDWSQVARLLNERKQEMVSLRVADDVLTKLGLALPTVYARVWVPDE